jgi:hypothetical protein
MQRQLNLVSAKNVQRKIQIRNSLSFPKKEIINLGLA